MDYQGFLAKKGVRDPFTGLPETPDLHPALFPFQRDLVRWALCRGRAALFADCGLGKSLMQLDWARHVPGPVLILAPLAVAQQTAREGAKFGIDVTVARKQADVVGKITVTNYEMVQHFDPSAFGGVVLDESSILKSHDGKTRTALIEAFAKTPFRLACTATPAPNDYMELANHAEFLGCMTRSEMLSMFFVHDGGETTKWRLKGHAQKDFWRWLTSWAIMLRSPADLGYVDDDSFRLPPLNMHQHTVAAPRATDGYLFALEAQTLQERIGAKRESVYERAAACAEIINGTDRPWIAWCNLNLESEALAEAIPDAVEIRGSDTIEEKERTIAGFLDGSIRVLISKPSMTGYGLNLQHCADMAFVGLSDSYEQLYQAIRRCWRFGQKRAVNVHLVVAESEGAVVANIKRKEEAARTMADAMIAETKSESLHAVRAATKRTKAVYAEDLAKGKAWTLYLGDCIEVLRGIPDGSIGYSIFSPPFSSLYTYSDSDRDMGNCLDDAQFFEHYGFLVQELYRVIAPGRLVSFHCMNLPTSKTHHGYIGVRDFRGDLIRMHEAAGMIFHSEVCIWKDPVTAMQRTKALGLLWKQIKKDSAMSRQGIPDYLVTMRKPGENETPISHTAEEFPVELWQRYASPVWMDINASETLQKESAREHEDERHIAPLQLEVIRRALTIWSAPGDLVLSPFAGIGSEGYVAVGMGRKFVGVELKRSYWEQARLNLAVAEDDSQGSLFS